MSASLWKFSDSGADLVERWQLKGYPGEAVDCTERPRKRRGDAVGCRPKRRPRLASTAALDSEYHNVAPVRSKEKKRKPKEKNEENAYFYGVSKRGYQRFEAHISIDGKFVSLGP